MAQNYGLGRGLSSLIPQKKNDQKTNDEKKEKTNSGVNFSATDSIFVGNKKTDDIDRGGKGDGVLNVDIEKIVPNPYQPRLEFDKGKLQELADSIKIHGVIQPLVVTRKKDGGEFELIAGERRLQASKLAGLKEVPVIIKEIKNKEKLELAIVENIQRHNLNPIEEAKAYKHLMEEFEMNQDDVARKMGKSRSAVANKLRLLTLPIEAIKALNEGKITEGHAKAILALKNQEKRRGLLDLIIKKNLTVREAEEKTREVVVESHKRRIIKADPALREMEEKFASSLGTKVKIKKSGNKGGKIIIDFYSSNELNDLIKKIVS